MENIDIHIPYMIISPQMLSALALSLITVVMLTLMNAPLDSSSEGYRASPPEEESLVNDEVLDSPFVRYESETHNYTLRYPGTWELDDSHTDFDGDILTDPSGRAVIMISATDDPEIASEEGQEYLYESIKESLEYDAGFALESYEPIIFKDRNTLLTTGTRRLGNTDWISTEYNVLRPEHGGILNVTVTIQADAIPLYTESVNAIVESLNVCPKSETLQDLQ